MADLLREEVGRLAAAPLPPKSKRLRENPWLNHRFAVADRGRTEPDRDKTIAIIAEELGETEATIRVWFETAEAEPDPAYRIAPWTTHRDMRKEPRRRELIRPGMTSREAREALGKTPIDMKTNSRLTVDDIAARVLEDYEWPGVREAVERLRDLTREQRLARNASRQAYRDRMRLIDNAKKKARKDWSEDSPYRVISDLKSKMLQFETDLGVITTIVLQFGRGAVPEEYWHEFLELLERVGDEAYDTINAINRGAPRGAQGSGPRQLPAPPDVEPS